jgi:hypothetical protein
MSKTAAPAKDSILRNDDGTKVRDDSALRDGMIVLIEQVRLIGCAWEMFPQIEKRHEYMDPIYRRLADLVEDLEQVDTRMGVKDESATA